MSRAPGAAGETSPGAHDGTLLTGRIPDPQPEHTPLFRGIARLLISLEAGLRSRGGKALRHGIRLFWTLLGLAGLFLLLGPVINDPPDLDEVIASADMEKVDWIARDVAIDYRVGTDENGAFEAQVDDAMTAHFVEDPHRTIERTFVTEFSGYDAGFELHRATIDGEPAETAVDRGPATTTVTISRADGEPFEGEQRVELSYELHNLVTTEADEVTGRDLDTWRWPLFAPFWPQGTSGIDVSLTFAPELDDALVRAPRAYVGWLLISGSEWLEPEGESAEGVRYEFGNDDNLPPNADLVVTASFEPGTFAQPRTTTLFWWQSYGPLLPMGVLLVLALFALVARRVVWADHVGEAWYSARGEPPDGLSPDEAAQLLGRPRQVELAEALAVRKDSPRRPREPWLRSVARAARRSGRIGNTPSVLVRLARWRLVDTPVKRGLRWAPDSYLRDTFLLGSVAIAMVQWGLLRQLSHQTVLAVVWWPAAFVLVSTALAAVAFWAVRRPRPLTRDGALLVQQLKGIDVYATETRLLERGPLDDPLLPYAILTERPRRAGREIAQQAARDSGARDVFRGWRTEHFVSLPAVVALVASVGLLAGSIAVGISVDPPYERVDQLTRFDDLPGTLRTQIEGFEIAAELTGKAGGSPRLEATERFQVRFTPEGPTAPQFAREWPSERLGQSLGLEVDDVRIDGETVPTRELEGPGTTAVMTQLEQPIEGLHEVEIDYALTSPVVEAEIADAEDPSRSTIGQQLRWSALFSFWEDTYYTDPSSVFDGTDPVRPLRIEFAIAPETAELVSGGGWLDYGENLDRVPGEFGSYFRDWVVEDTMYGDGEDLDELARYDLTVGTETVRGDGTIVYAIDVDEIELAEVDREALLEGVPDSEAERTPVGVEDPIRKQIGAYELGLSGGDVGALLDFPAGTFAGVEEGARGRYLTGYWAPYAAMMVLGAVVTGAAVATFEVARRMRRRAGISLRIFSFAALPIAAIAHSVVFGWTAAHMAMDDGAGWGTALGALMYAAVIAQCILVGMRTFVVGRGTPDAEKEKP